MTKSIDRQQNISYAQAVCWRAAKEEIEAFKANVIINVQQWVKIFFSYIHYIIHCKIKRDNHQVPKITRVPRNKTNSKKIKIKIYK